MHQMMFDFFEMQNILYS